jgi:arylsulfatase
MIPSPRLGFPYAVTPNIDALIEKGVALLELPHHRAELRSLTRQPVHRLLSAYDGRPCQWPGMAADLGRAAAGGGLSLRQCRQDAHHPYNSDSGFHERYVVENKDRYMEGRWYFDEWDKALAANGLVKQQREQYRERDDYGERLGAFDWELPEQLHSDAFVGNMAKWWVNTYPPTEPLFLQVGFPGPHPPFDPPARYSEPYLSAQRPAAAEADEGRARYSPPRAEGQAAA